jgi:hypothetical protein
MTNSKVKGFLIERDGRSLFMKEVEAWAIEDVNYKVTPLVSGLIEDREEPLGEVPKEEALSLPSTDDTAERIELMNELFSLQDLEISQLKGQLEKFVEVVEGIVELTEVVSQDNIENRSKLLVISKSCKEILKPSE